MLVWSIYRRLSGSQYAHLFEYLTASTAPHCHSTILQNSSEDPTLQNRMVASMQAYMPAYLQRTLLISKQSVMHIPRSPRRSEVPYDFEKQMLSNLRERNLKRRASYS